jgi:RHS repeat-associated protein
MAKIANRSRYIRKDIQKSGSAKVTHYLGSVEYIYENDEVKARGYIGNLVIGIKNQSNNHNLWSHKYLLKDHIGSTHTIVDKNGNILSNMSFNAWGARRQPPIQDSAVVFQDYHLYDVWTLLGYGVNGIDNTTNRVFTGHEHFDQVGIIHMNGRIYDPSIGRFLQADPVIQDPYNTQSLNRYSYVMNNPLSYTDPTGYFRLRKGWFRQIAAIGVLFIPIPVGNAYLSAFISGALSGGIATGTLKEALKGAIQATVTYGIGHGTGGFKGEGWVKPGMQRAIAHGIVGGISAELDGGKFGHGFASSVLTSGADKLFNGGIKGNSGARVVANAIIAGTISQATGGKFANGAMSASFRLAFNELAGMVSKLEKIVQIHVILPMLKLIVEEVLNTMVI